MPITQKEGQIVIPIVRCMIIQARRRRRSHEILKRIHTNSLLDQNDMNKALHDLGMVTCCRKILFHSLSLPSPSSSSLSELPPDIEIFSTGFVE